jgi:hypothetical protein
MAASKRLTPEMVGEGRKVQATLDPIRVDIDTLTGRQIHTIEVVSGVPMTRLAERASDVMLAAAVRHAIEGAPVDAYLDFPALELVNSVEFVGDEDDDPGNG